ncbi:MAG TPA: c-type cytochrome biogenesis protein CcmI [Terriglobia bacterium]|nr:c-type cytochrome biogenesis protein CcmI [Terriglobia bacterium]
MKTLLMLLLLIPTSDGPALEQRVMTLSQQLRCLVCQNQTIADSQADLAADLRQQIREQMKAGRTDTQITAFMTDRYGDYVLYRPPVKPRTVVLWFGPFVLLTAGLAGLFRFLKRWPGSTRRPLAPVDKRKAAEILREGTNPNVEVYREQFADLESDLRRGVLPREQFDKDREELERRLLEDCGRI